MGKNREQNTRAKHHWENAPGKFIEEVPLKNIHQIKHNYWLSVNESQYISPVKKDRMFIVHFKIHCQRLSPNITHSMWYYQKKVWPPLILMPRMGHAIFEALRNKF